jgi:hypothetical protein
VDEKFSSFSSTSCLVIDVGRPPSLGGEGKFLELEFFFLRRGGEDMLDAFCTVHSRKAWTNERDECTALVFYPRRRIRRRRRRRRRMNSRTLYLSLQLSFC